MGAPRENLPRERSLLYMGLVSSDAHSVVSSLSMLRRLAGLLVQTAGYTAETREGIGS